MHGARQVCGDRFVERRPYSLETVLVLLVLKVKWLLALTFNLNNIGERLMK